MQLGEEFRRVTAEMIHAEPDEIAIMGNTTEGVNVAINGLRYASGDVVVTSNTEHSGWCLRTTCASGTADLRIVAARGRGLARVDPGVVRERPRRRAGAPRGDLGDLVLDGAVAPLKEIDAAHRVGAEVLVDGAQTAGHVPIDVRASGVDYYAIPSHKWLCGPDGLGALYVRRDRILTLELQKVAWGRAARTTTTRAASRRSATRSSKFELTTISGVLLAGTNAATRLYVDSGPEAVFARACELNRYAEQRFASIRGVRVTGPTLDGTRSGLFLFSVEGVNPARDVAFLQQEAKVVCWTVVQFDSGIRLSLHCFNTEAEIDRAAEAERAVREASRTWCPPPRLRRRPRQLRRETRTR
ncbi:MAG: aminotransferase class V-fold PLP-dependent enzyme [Dehalococcoidia bacterium]